MTVSGERWQVQGEYDIALEAVRDLKATWDIVKDQARSEVVRVLADSLSELIEVGMTQEPYTADIVTDVGDNAVVDAVAVQPVTSSQQEVHHDQGSTALEVLSYRANRQLIIGNRFDRFVAGLSPEPDETGFVAGDHQIHVLNSFNSFLQMPLENGNTTRKCLNWLSFSGGKTALEAVISRAIGVGELVDDSDVPVTALVILDTIQASDQTVGRELNKGYTIFAPDIPVGEWNQRSKDLSQPVTVMTYASFRQLSDDVRAELKARVDILFLDEAHRALGKNTREVLLPFMEDIITVASTGTANFSEVRGVKSELGIDHEIAHISPREAIENWEFANGVQILMLATGARVIATGPNGTFVESDTLHLVDDRSRNELIVDSLQFAVENGLPGLAMCIKGGGSRHARDIAAMACARRIPDPVTGELRNLRVAAIGDFLSLEQRKQLLAEFETGQLDYLTFTEYLKENYDSNRVASLIAAAPTTSQLDIDQFFGRGARPKDKLTLCMQIVDRQENVRRRSATFLITVGETAVKQGVVIGRPARRQTSGGNRPSFGRKRSPRANGSDTADGRIDAANLPDSLQAAADEIAGTLVDELTIISQRFQSAPRDWVPLHTTAFYGSVTPEVAIHTVARLDIPRRKAEGGIWYIPPDAPARLDEHIIPVAETTLVTYPVVMAELNASWRMIDDAAHALNLPVEKRKIPGSRNAEHLARAHIELIGHYLRQQYPLVDPEVEESVLAMAEELGRSPGSLRLYLSRHKVPTHMKYSPQRNRRLCVEKSTAGIVKRRIGKLPLEVTEEDEIINNNDELTIISSATTNDAAQVATTATKAPAHNTGSRSDTTPKVKQRKPDNKKPKVNNAPRSDEADIPTIAEMHGANIGEVKAAIKRLKQQKRIVGLPAQGIIRQLPGGQQARHFGGSTLAAIDAEMARITKPTN